MRRRARIIERRKIVGLSQERLAEAVGVDRNTIMRWENGEFTPQPGQRPPLAKALRVSVEELHALLGSGIPEQATGGTAIESRTVSGLLVPAQNRHPGAVHPAPESALTWTGVDDPLVPDDQLGYLLRQLDAADGGDDWRSPKRREDAYLQLVQFLARWAHTVKRRETLRVLGWAAAAAAGSAELPVLDEQESERVVRAIQTPQRVDDQVIDHIEAVLRHCMRQDDTLGPQAAFDTVLAQRSLARSLLPEAPVAVRGRLRSVYASLSRSAGWLSFDLRSYDTAAEYFESARATAHDAHHTELAAHVLCNMSQMATWRGLARTGIDHAVAAQGWANQTDDRRLRAYAWDVTARALAVDGQGTAALNAIERAQQLLAEADAGRSSLAYFLHAGGLTSSEGMCHLDLGDFDRGAAVAEAALTSIDPSFVRDRALTSVRLGICRLRTTKPDVVGAAQAIAEAGALAARNRSPRLVESVRRGVAELEPWQDVPEVRDVRHELTAHGLA